MWLSLGLIKAEKKLSQNAFLSEKKAEVQLALSGLNGKVEEFLSKDFFGQEPLPSMVRASLILSPKGELLSASHAFSLWPVGKEGQEKGRTSDEASVKGSGFGIVRQETPYLPYWQGRDLIFLKQKPTEQGNYTLVVWVDGAMFKEFLLEPLKARFPAAELISGLEQKTQREQQRAKDVVQEELWALPAVFFPYGQDGTGMEALKKEEESRQTGQVFSLLGGVLGGLWLLALLSAGVLVWQVLALKRLNDKRSLFVSALTHELRTPLTSFSLYTEMLDEGLVSEAKKPQYFRLLREQAGRLSRLLENVFFYAQVERKGRGLDLVKVSALDFCQRVQTRVMERLKGQEVELSWRLGEGMTSQEELEVRGKLLSVSWDEVAGEQIVDNVVDNFLKYGRGLKACLEVSFIQKGKRLFVIFSDQGAGVDKGMQKRLFEPFTRAAEVAAGQEAGVGLGLSLVRKMARSMGGEFMLLETSQKGSSFAWILALFEEE